MFNLILSIILVFCHSSSVLIGIILFITGSIGFYIDKVNDKKRRQREIHRIVEFSKLKFRVIYNINFYDKNSFENLSKESQERWRRLLISTIQDELIIEFPYDDPDELYKIAENRIPAII